MTNIAEPIIEEELISSLFGVVGIAVIAGIADTITPKIINYEVEKLEWLSPQPLYPNTEFGFELRIHNYGSTNSLRVVLYLDGLPTGHEYSGVIGGGKVFSCIGSLVTPSEFGIYSITAEITVGNEIKEFQVSTLYVTSFSIEEMHWQRTKPMGTHIPPYINIGTPVGAIRPDITYMLSYRIRNNSDVRREYEVKWYSQGEAGLRPLFSVDPGELSAPLSVIFNAPGPGVYPITIRVLVDGVPDLPATYIPLIDAIVSVPPVDFVVDGAIWDDIMPFDINTIHSYEFNIDNLGEKSAIFDVDIYLNSHHTTAGILYFDTHRRTILAGSNATFTGSLVTPETFDRYDLLVRVVIDNVFEEWYVVSYADVGKRIAIDGIGDLNDDGFVSPADYDILRLYIRGSLISDISPLTEDEFIRRADINTDGRISIVDAMLLRNIFLFGYN